MAESISVNPNITDAVTQSNIKVMEPRMAKSTINSGSTNAITAIAIPDAVSDFPAIAFNAFCQSVNHSTDMLFAAFQHQIDSIAHAVEIYNAAVIGWTSGYTTTDSSRSSSTDLKA